MKIRMRGVGGVGGGEVGVEGVCVCVCDWLLDREAVLQNMSMVTR